MWETISCPCHNFNDGLTKPQLKFGHVCENSSLCFTNSSLCFPVSKKMSQRPTLLRIKPFSPPLLIIDPDLHHGTCVTHVPWCIPGSLTSGFLWSRWRGNVPGIPGACATRNLRIWYETHWTLMTLQHNLVLISSTKQVTRHLPNQ